MHPPRITSLRTSHASRPALPPADPLLPRTAPAAPSPSHCSLPTRAHLALARAQGDEGHDCWVIESGEVVASILIPGIRFAGTWEWKQTIKYSPGRTPFFGERGLLRKEPRPARMTCLTDTKALRIVAE
eukprot:1852898-Prymnesium_polylepis.1